MKNDGFGAAGSESYAFYDGFAVSVEFPCACMLLSWKLCIPFGVFCAFALLVSKCTACHSAGKTEQSSLWGLGPVTCGVAWAMKIVCSGAFSFRLCVT